jgi:hypothetical protein
MTSNTGDIVPPTRVGVILQSRPHKAETGKEAISLTLIFSQNLAISAFFSHETSQACPFLLP